MNNSMLLDFCNQHKELYIYGNGRFQHTLRDYLVKNGFLVQGFVVSDEYDTEDTEKLYCISELKQKIIDIDNSGIVISISDKHYNAVLNNIFKNGFDIDKILILPNYLKSEIRYDVDIGNKSNKVISDEIIEEFFKHYNDIVYQCDKASYNILCHMHLGDTVMFMALKDNFEKKYGNRIHYLIPENHEFLAKLYNIQDYSVVEFKSSFDNTEYDRDTQRQLYIHKMDLYNKICSCVPQIGSPFVPAGINILNKAYPPVNFTDESARLLGLVVRKVHPPARWKELSEEMKMIIRNLGAIQDIVLLAPEASSVDILPPFFWEELALKIKKRGKIPVCNVMDDKNRIENATNIKVSLSDLIALGNQCYSVHSIRSGLCDCLACIGEKLNVYYPDEARMNYYSLNDCFELTESVKEEVIINY